MFFVWINLWLNKTWIRAAIIGLGVHQIGISELLLKLIDHIVTLAIFTGTRIVIIRFDIMNLNYNLTLARLCKSECKHGCIQACFKHQRSKSLQKDREKLGSFLKDRVYPWLWAVFKMIFYASKIKPLAEPDPYIDHILALIRTHPHHHPRHRQNHDRRCCPHYLLYKSSLYWFLVVKLWRARNAW